jgi:hypothetical protein
MVEQGTQVALAPGETALVPMRQGAEDVVELDEVSLQAANDPNRLVRRLAVSHHILRGGEGGGKLTSGRSTRHRMHEADRIFGCSHCRPTPSDVS